MKKEIDRENKKAFFFQFNRRIITRTLDSYVKLFFAFFRTVGRMINHWYLFSTALLFMHLISHQSLALFFLLPSIFDSKMVFYYCFKPCFSISAYLHTPSFRKRPDMLHISDFHLRTLLYTDPIVLPIKSIKIYFAFYPLCS
ncbi:uncharacterized protein EV154DRAFT_518466 [Mucor mucedo]|uniref:uncharacterized protein n=1 Tax=Mucor mucedo TaxID=29922 RepID=UPI002220F6F0|nr:uncharacterized protein EV154DRAFT_518466 [Mucor mucedo]KAI7888145.1 hypothetical protein EV154DRAFT_518466 [Mucor mucedo]